MTAPLIVWFHFILNLLLQALDGILTYHVLSLGIPEANPLVSSAITHWGALWGLLYWKTLACALLVLVFALRHRRQALTLKALMVTEAVYAYVAVSGLWVLFLEF
jgi:hypothetical protein